MVICAQQLSTKYAVCLGGLNVQIVQKKKKKKESMDIYVKEVLKEFKGRTATTSTSVDVDLDST